MKRLGGRTHTSRASVLCNPEAAWVRRDCGEPWERPAWSPSRSAISNREGDAEIVRETREALKMSRHLFAFKIGVNPRTLERWEQGRSKPNEQAAALIWLVRKYPDTLKRLESLAAST